MLIRVVALLTILGIKILINLFSSLDYQNNSNLLVKGYVYKIDQIGSKCIIGLGRYFAVVDGWCKFSRGDRLSVSGRYKRRLIDAIYGKIYLSDAVIDEINNEGKKSTAFFNAEEFFNRFRENIVSKYYKLLPNREASLVAGIVLGDKQGISGEFYQQMVNSGTIHIAVASGYNLMLVGGTALTLLFWVMKRGRATIVTILIMLFYTLVSGADPPVIRAFFMASMVFIGKSIGRGQGSWWALLLTAWMMVMFDLSLLTSVSFQLSVAASIGLMVIEPVIMKYFDTQNSRLIHIFGRLGLTTTVSTMLLTAPIIWWHFGRFGFMGLLSNGIILPMVPMVMVLGALMIVFGAILTVPVYVVSHIMVLIIGWLGS